jgi:hypothetical protein
MDRSPSSEGPQRRLARVVQPHPTLGCVRAHASDPSGRSCAGKAHQGTRGAPRERCSWDSLWRSSRGAGFSAPSGTAGVFIEGSQHQEGNGPGDRVRLSTQTNFEGSEPRRGGSFSQAERGQPLTHAASRNATNPRAGSGMQQARRARAEQTAEVVRNHEGGTRWSGWSPLPEARGDASGSGREGGGAGARLEQREGLAQASAQTPLGRLRHRHGRGATEEGRTAPRDDSETSRHRAQGALGIARAWFQGRTGQREGLGLHAQAMQRPRREAPETVQAQGGPRERPTTRPSPNAGR